MSCQSERIKNEMPASFSTGLKGKRMEPRDNTFYWNLVNFTPDMDKFRVIHAFETVFKEHLEPNFGGIKFKSTSEKSEAHFKIHFAKNGDAILPQPFDPSTLAYAYFVRGDSFFNDAFNWGMMNSATHVNLKKVAVHEFLHNLNLGHSTDRNDILYYANMPENEITFTQDTLDGIHALYGDLMKRDEEIISGALSKIFYDPKRIARRPNKKSLKAICDVLTIDNSGRVIDLRKKINNALPT